MAIVSDFYAEPDVLMRQIEPLRQRGNDVVLFHVLDPQEIHPQFQGAQLFVDMESERKLEVSSDYLRGPYLDRLRKHLETIQTESRRTGLDYMLLSTEKPLDAALREYLSIRQGRF